MDRNLALFSPLSMSDVKLFMLLKDGSGYYPFLLQVRGCGVPLIPLSFGIFSCHYKRN